MTSYNIYPDLPKKPSDPLKPQSYCSNAIQSKQQRLLELKERYAKIYSKYSKILSRLVWLNACSSCLTVAAGISSVVTMSSCIGLLLNIPLGVVSLAGANVNGLTTTLTFKYQKKSSKVTILVDIVTSAIAVFITIVSKILEMARFDE